MTHDREEAQDQADEQLSDAYREAVGSVMAARNQYDQACAANGSDSLAASQANDHLAQEISHRNELREQYERVLNQRPKR